MYLYFLLYNFRAFFYDLLIPQILGPDVHSSLERLLPGFETYVSVLDKSGRGAPQACSAQTFQPLPQRCEYFSAL